MLARNGLNHFFRHVWSHATQSWHVAPETAKRSHKGGRLSRTLRAAVGAVGSFVLGSVTTLTAAQQAPPVNQLPTAGIVARGAATITQSSSANSALMNINQSSQRAVINWNTFNVGQNATVNFNQPNASSVTLNNIADQNPSQVYGQVKANGQVYLSNPSGILFSPSASVDVKGLVATTHSMDADAFMAGNTTFARGNATGSVINQGNISTALQGYVALLAPHVQNSGVIVAQSGTVALASGDLVSLNFNGQGGLAGITTTPSSIASLIENKLAVRAPDGLIIISAVGMSQLQAGVVNNSGVLEANSLTDKGGKITLEADTISLGSASNISATGPNAGGTILIGGGWQGGGELRSATSLTMSVGASIDASATGNGSGGTVVLWSDTANPNGQTVIGGSIKADGGPAGGDGGRIETSGHYLNVNEVNVSTRSASGNYGTWLLDPSDLTIGSGTDVNYTVASNTYTPNATSSYVNVGTLATALAASNVTVTSCGTGTGVGNITLTDNLSWSANTTLTLSAYKNININASISVGGSTSNAGLILKTNQGNTGGDYNFGMTSTGFTGNVSFASTSSTFQTQNYTNTAASYTLINAVSNTSSIFSNTSSASSTNFALTQEINAATFTGYTNVRNGTYSGIFTGLGHSISNLTLSGSAANAGFFSGGAATIRDVGFIGANVSGSSNIGILMGSATGALTLQNIFLKDSKVNATSTGAGALVGCASLSGSLSNAYGTNVSVTGTTYVGGLLGYGNLSLDSATYLGNVTGTGNVGGVVGYSNATSLSNLTFNGTINGAGNTGGIAGQFYSTSANNTFSNLTSHGLMNITSASLNIGGAFGLLYLYGSLNTVNASLNLITSDVQISATSGALGSNIGGLLGYAYSYNYYPTYLTLNNSSYSSGNLSGTSYVGGLVGNSSISSFTVNNSYSALSGNISATGTYVGGLLGYGGGSIYNSNATVSSVNGTTYIGGLAGYFSGTIQNAFYSGNIVANTEFGGLFGLLGSGNQTIINSFYNANSTYFTINGTRSNNIITPGAVYETQWNTWVNSNQIVANRTLNPVTYFGSQTNISGTNYYLISSTADFANLLGVAEAGTGYRFALGGNLSLAGASNPYIPYLGATEFYGQGNTISNLSLGRQTSGIGLFGYAAGTQIHDLNITTATVSGNVLNGTSYVGGLIGSAGNVNVSNIGVTLQGNVTGTTGVGGVIGYGAGAYNSSTLSNLTISTTPTPNYINGSGSSYVGGIAGYMLYFNANNLNSTAYLNVSTTNYVGGIFGSFAAASIGQNSVFSNSTSSATILTSGGNYVGGAAGYINLASVINVSAYGNIGAPNSTTNYVGGLIGSLARGNLTNSNYANGTVYGGSIVGGLVGGTSRDTANITISNSYTSQNVFATNDFAGGLVGLLGGTLSASNYTLNATTGTGTVTGRNDVGGLVGRLHDTGCVTNSYSTGSINAAYNYGGLVGFLTPGSTLTNSYYNIDHVSITALTPTSTATRIPVTGTVITAGGIYDSLYQQWFHAGALDGINTTSAVSTFGALSGGAYVLNNVNDLTNYLGYAEVTSMNFKLGASISLTSAPNLYIPYVGGKFDPNGFQISNLLLSQYTSNLGFIGYFNGSANSAPIVTGLTVLNSNITGKTNLGLAVGSTYAVTLNAPSTSGNVTGSDITYAVDPSEMAIASTAGLSNTGGVLGYGLGLNGTSVVLTGTGLSNVVTNANVSGGSDVGGLAGRVYNGNISNLSSSGSVTGTANATGGLIGRVTNTNVSNASSSGNVSGTMYTGGLVGNSDLINNFNQVSSTSALVKSNNSYLGGLLGYFYQGNLTNSQFVGNVGVNTTTPTYVGGLVGYDYYSGNISNSSVTGNVSGNSYVGGLIGYYVSATTSNVSNISMTGNVSGSTYTGGFAGSMANVANVTGATISANVTGVTSNTGGFAGYISAGTVTNTTISGTLTGSSYTGGFSGTTSAVTYATTITNVSTSMSVNSTGNYAGGFSGMLQSSTAGLTVNASSATGNVTGGNFTGGFAGEILQSTGAVTATNLTATGKVVGTAQVGGFVGYQLNATVTSSNAYGNVTGSGADVGGFVGSLAGSTSTATVNASNAFGNVNGTQDAGGFVGLAGTNSSVSYSSAAGNVTNTTNGSTSRTGGFVGYFNSASNTSTISNSRASGIVSGTTYVGGFAGDVAANGSITNAYETGAVIASNSSSGGVGGFAGYLEANFNGTISNIYETGSVLGQSNLGGLIGYAVHGNITNGYAVGYLSSSTNSAVGATFGFINASSSAGNYAVNRNNLYFDNQTTNIVTDLSGGGGNANVSGATGCTTAQMQTSTLLANLPSANWTAATGLFPYLTSIYSSAPTAISGYAYLANGTAASNASVGVYGGGKLLNSGLVTTGANGYFYEIVSSGVTFTSSNLTVSTTTPLAATLVTGGNITGMIYSDRLSLTSNVVNLSSGTYTGNLTQGLTQWTTNNLSASTLNTNLNTTLGSSNYAAFSSNLTSATSLVLNANAASYAQDTALAYSNVTGSLANAGSITINSVGNLTLSGNNISSSGVQNFSAPLILLGTDLNITATNANITFNGPLRGDGVSAAKSLTVSSGSGNVSFGGALGSTTPLAESIGALTINSSGLTSFSGTVDAVSLSTDAGGTTQVSGGRVTTTGSQAYLDNLLATNATTLTGSTIAIGGNVTANNNLSLNANSITLNASTVTSSGFQNYNGQLLLGSNATIAAGGNITLTGVDSTTHTTANSLSLTATNSTLTINGNVGATNPLLALSASANLTSIGNTSDVEFDALSNVFFSGNIALNRTATINSTQGNISLQGNVSTSSSRSLTLLTGSGNVSVSPNLSGIVDLNVSGTNITLGNVQASGHITLSPSNSGNVAGCVSGSADLIKSGTGSLYLAGSDTYSGGTTINSGVLSLARESSLGTSSVQVNAGGYLDLTGVDLATTNVTLNGGMLQVSGGNGSVASNVTTTANSGFKATGGNLNVTSALNTGSYGLAFTGTNGTGNISLSNVANSISLVASSTSVGSVTVNDIAPMTVGNFSVNGVTFSGLNAANDVTVLSSSTVTLAPNVTSSSSAGNFNLVAAKFINNAGSSAFNVASTKYWRLWSTNSDPFDNNNGDQLGSLSSNFSQYNATYGNTQVLGSGNGTLYTLAPQLSLVLTGIISKTYDGTANVTLTGTNINANGTINNDSIASLNATSSAFTDTGTGTSIAGVGTNKTVTATGLNSVIASHSGKPVYGYILQTANATGTGEITQAPLTLNLTKTYDSTVNISSNSTAIFGGLAPVDANVSISLSGSGQVSSPNVGNYTNITSNFTINNPNYLLSTVNARIDQAPITYTVSNVTSTYGTQPSLGSLTFGGVMFSDQNNVTASVIATSNGSPLILAANTPAGNYVQQASNLTGPAASNYFLASSGNTQGTLTVQPAPLTITSGSATKTYGQTYSTSTSLFTPNGLVAGDSITSVVQTVSGGTSAHDSVGSYTITPSGANGSSFNPNNYVITYQSGTLTVQPATLTYTIGNATSTYGTAPVLGNVTFGGLYSTDTVVATLGISNGNGSASVAANTPAGNYTQQVTAITGSLASNYILASSGNTQGTLTVNPKALSITTSAATKTFGQTYSPSSSSFTSSGLVAGDTIASVIQTASGGTAALDNVGNYTLTPSGASGSSFNPNNYIIAYHSGTLTVTPLAVSLNGTKNYDGTTTLTPGTTGSSLSVSNLVAGAPVNVTGSAVLTSSGPGNESISQYSGLALDNANYTLIGAQSSVHILSASQINLQPLTGAEVSALIATQLANLTSSQLGGLSGSQLQVFSAAQVSALSPSQMSGISASQLSGLSASQVSGITPNQLSILTPQQVGGLSASQLGGMTPTQVQALTASQVVALSPSQISGLSGTQLSAMSVSQIQSLSPTQISALSPAQLAGLSPAQIASLGASQLGGLTAAQLATLSPSQVAAMSSMQVGNLSGPQVSALTAIQIASLQPSQVAVISSLGNFNSDQVVELTPAQIAAVSPAQINQLSMVQISALSSAQVQSFTPSQVSGLSRGSLSNITPSQLASLTVSQLQSLTPTQVSQLSALQIGGLNAQQIQGLSIQQVAGLSAQQVGQLSPTQISNLDPSQLQSLSAQQLSGIRVLQAASLPPALAQSLTAQQLAAMSTVQIAALTSGSSLTIEQINALPSASVVAISPQLLASMTASQVSSIDSTQLKSMSPDQLSAFGSAQFSGLTVTQMSSLSGVQLRSLSVEQINMLNPEQARGLSNVQLSLMTPVQIAALTKVLPSLSKSNAPQSIMAGQTNSSEESANGLSINNLTGAQVRTLTETEIKSIPVEQVSEIALSQIKSLSVAQMASLSNEQANSLTQAQVASMNPAQVAALTSIQHVSTVAETIVFSHSATMAGAGTLPITVLGNGNSPSASIQFRQEGKQVTLQISKADVTPDTSTPKIDESMLPQTFAVPQSDGSQVQFRGVLSAGHLVISAPDDAAKTFLLKQLPSVVAAAVSSFPEESRVSMNELKGVILDLR